MLMFHSVRKHSHEIQEIMTAKAGTAQAPYINMQHRINDALGSISWAVMVLPRNDLLTVASKFTEFAGLAPRKSLEEQSEKGIREFLNGCAEKLYKTDPEKLVQLDEYLLAYGRARLQKMTR